MLLIKSWTGRLGNNIQQLVNCIYFANYFGHKTIKFPNHKFLHGNELILNIEEKTDIQIQDTFFYIKKLNEKYGFPLNLNNTKISLECLREIFKIKSNVKFNENDLLIHIRSGDIFSNSPHAYFVPPPFSFYKKVINSRDWNDIYIVAEDTKNPIINKLLNTFDIKFKKQSLEDDIKMILGFHNICFGVGTFIPSLLLFSSEIKNIFYPKYCERYMIQHLQCNKYVTLLKDYIKPGDWKNTPKQQLIILT